VGLRANAISVGGKKFSVPAGNQIETIQLTASKFRLPTTSHYVGLAIIFGEDYKQWSSNGNKIDIVCI
jgi:hypothetical protein